MWGMRQHGESTRSCELLPSPIGAQRKFGDETTARSSWSCAFCLLVSCWMVCEWLRELVPGRSSHHGPSALGITCSLGLPSLLEGITLVAKPRRTWGRHTSSARTARSSVPLSRVARSRPGRRRCRFSRFPLLAPEARCGALRAQIEVYSPTPQKP